MKFDVNKDYYAILGVAPNADDATIHKAYKKLVSQYHPDKHQGNDLQELAKEKLTAANEAFDVLSKEQIKAAYDESRRTRNVPGGQRNQPYSSGSDNAPQAPPKQAAAVLRKTAVLILFLAALPFVLRFVRSPRIAAVIGVAIFVAWFGPRLLKKISKK